MGLGAVAIEADADPLNPGSFDLSCRLLGDQGSVRCHHHPKPFPASIASKFKEVGP